MGSDRGELTAWRPPTYAAATGTSPTQLLRCPGCRREVPASMLYDFAGLPAAQAPPFGRYGCYACRHRLELSGAVTRQDYLRAVGAPAALVARSALAPGGGLS